MTHATRPALLALLLAFAFGTAEAAAGPRDPQRTQQQTQSSAKAKHKAKDNLDRSGRTRVGKASFYSRRFAGRRMADGTPMRPNTNNAASKTLPLGTTARVTNLETGKSATVTVRDRGPHVRGRIIDLSPATAREIGITREEGVARVEVTPIHVPDPSGAADPPPANRVASRKP